MIIVNKMVNSNANKPESNTKKAYINIINVINKIISNAKKTCINITASNNNKMAIINEDNAKKVYVNIVAIANIIIIAKKDKMLI